MKTFTLRLTDLEAEALERLAALEKVSKNQLIKNTITENYSDIDTAAVIIDNELISISTAYAFPAIVDAAINNLIELGKVSDSGVYPYIPPVRAAKYVLENKADELTLEETEDINKFMHGLKEQIKQID